MPHELVTSAQAAEYLQVNLTTIYRWIREGRLNAARVGKGYRIPMRNLDQLLLENRVRDDIPVRVYDEDQIARFIQDDRLTPEAERVVLAFQSIPD